MDPISFQLLSGSAGAGGLPTEIGEFGEGGYFAGYISTSENGVATHGLIVAPAASGYNGKSQLQWKTSRTDTSGTSSFIDGASNTSNMANSSHPAANYCAGLTINGYSDWYLPARWELEVAYYNLKPTTQSNVTYSFLKNPYSVPSRATTAYTTSTPSQTSVSLFQSGGSEAFVAAEHWSSSDSGSQNAYEIWFTHGSQQHDNDSYYKTTSQYVRAFRKFALP